MTNEQPLNGFYSYGFVDGQSVVMFIPCLQVTVPAFTIVIRPLWASLTPR